MVLGMGGGLYIDWHAYIYIIIYNSCLVFPLIHLLMFAQQKYSDEEEDGSPSKSYGHTVRGCVCVCLFCWFTDFSFHFQDSDSGYKLVSRARKTPIHHVTCSLSLSLTQTKGSKEVVDSSDSGISNGLEASKVWQVQIHTLSLSLPANVTSSL